MTESVVVPLIDEAWELLYPRERHFSETEVNYPVRILRYELVDDSDGPGRRRGGLGLRRDYAFTGHEVSFTPLPPPTPHPYLTLSARILEVLQCLLQAIEIGDFGLHFGEMGHC